MKLTIKLSDDLHDQLVATAKLSRLSVEALIEKRLLEVADLPTTTRTLLLHGPALATIERAVNRSMNSADELATTIVNLASLEIGTHKLQLSPGQLLAAKHRADKMGWAFDRYLEDVYQRVGGYIAQEL